MPDGLQISVASAFPPPSPNRPVAFLKAAIAAVVPLIDPETCQLKEGLDFADVAGALRSVAGDFTIGDIVLLVDGLDGSLYRSNLTSLEESAVSEVYHTFQEFIFSAHALTREDVDARAGYVIQPDRFVCSRHRMMLSKMLAFDISALLTEDFASGHCFGGAQPNQTDDVDPVPWWKTRDDVMKQVVA